MFEDGADERDDADAASRRPLPPEDRLWRHPSELTAAARPQPGGSTLALVMASGLVGAVVTLTVLVAAGAFDDDPPTPVIERVEPEPATADQHAVAATALAGVARVEVDAADGRRSGTGLVIRDDGHVLTAADLVGDADEVIVVLADGTTVSGSVVGTDHAADLAVVKIDGVGLEPIMLGSAVDLMQGEAVLAVALPADHDGARVTQGIVLGLSEELPGQQLPMQGLLLTSAEVGTLPAGSAVLDQRGALVGVTTARIPSPDAGGDGTYATPIEYAYDVADELMRDGKASHPWLGLEARDATAADDTATGAYVTAVADRSPAAEAGLRRGDIVTRVAGDDVTSVGELAVALRMLDPGDTIGLHYRRGDEVRSCTPVLGERPART